MANPPARAFDAIFVLQNDLSLLVDAVESFSVVEKKGTLFNGSSFGTRASSAAAQNALSQTNDVQMGSEPLAATGPSSTLPHA